MVAPEVIDEVRRLVDPVLVVGQRLKLWRCGVPFAALCPFHEDRKGEFRLYAGEKRFVCYGCGARGDLFEFVQRADRKAFPAVLRELAASVGIVIRGEGASDSPGQEQAKALRAKLLAACAVATSHWEKRLWSAEGKEAREYLALRGVGEEAARAFRLGYALASWHDLGRALEATGIRIGVLHDAGLVAAKEEPGKPTRYYDRFRNRIMLPVTDARGRVTGFGGRALTEDGGAIYLNGPETALYRKGHALFGLHQASEAIRRTGRALLVEGYFDVIALRQAGFAMAVAACGTAVSPEQLLLLGAAGCRELVVLFDGDDAGARAPAKAARALLRAPFSVSVAQLSAGMDGESDPDVLVARSGKRGVEQVLAAARPLTEFLIDDALARHADGQGSGAPVEHKLRVLGALTPLVAAAPEGLARATFEKAVARRLAVDIGPLRQEVQRATRAVEEGGRPCGAI